MRIIGLLCLIAVTAAAAAQPVEIHVHCDQQQGAVSPYLTGACIEDVNHEIYGGLYSQLLFGESFQEPADPVSHVSGMWSPIQTGSATLAATVSTTQPFIGSQSQQMSFTAGSGEVGIANAGLNHWGIGVVAGKDYDGYLWLRAPVATTVFVSLQSRDGVQRHAESSIVVNSSEWRRYDFSLTASGADAAARFAVTLRSPGSVMIGHAFLEPGEWGRFHKLPVRKDVADAIVATGYTVMRYGGSMVNEPQYRWKKMIGPRDRRPPYRGHWYPYSSNGWAIPDFLNFAEAAGLVAIPDFCADETPQDMADFLEYANGSADSTWGRRRAADGHPKPYHVRYLQFGNEESVDDAYFARFKPAAEAMWAKDPDVTIIVGDFDYDDPITDPDHVTRSHVTTLAAHKQILDLAAAHHRAVWFDVHINNDAPSVPDPQLAALPTLATALHRLSPDADFKICVFEENANTHNFGRALAHAKTISYFESLGDRFPILAAANCLQCDGQNDNGWDQGFIFLNPTQVWLQPQAYVTQMFHLAEPSRRLVITSATDPDLILTALADRAGSITLQAVNLSDHSIQAAVHLDGSPPPLSTCTLTQLSASPNATNTASDPTKVTPTSRTLPAATRLTLPPHSVTTAKYP